MIYLSRFKAFLGYKLKNVGCDVSFINEAYTSRINYLTGRVEFDSSLNNRVFYHRGIEIDRDFNSCINISTNSGICSPKTTKVDLLLNKMSEIKLNKSYEL